MSQTQGKRTSREDAAVLAEKDAARQQDTERGRREAKIAGRQEKLDDLDDLLDEIDGLLEENASEVLAAYRQKGGQLSVTRRIIDPVIAGILVTWNTVRGLTTMRLSDLISQGTWRVDADRGVVYGRGRSLAAWRPIGTLRSGYLRLRIGYKGPSVTAHRVIWEFAYGPSDLGLTINHKNGIKTDNRIANLELATNRENVVHAFETGLGSRASRNVGSRNGMAKLTEDQAAEIRRRRAAGERGRALAAEFEISQQAVCNIHKGRGWA